MPQCRNCTTTFDGEYCPTCGQRDVDLERPIWDLVGGLLKETFELDGRAALTIKTLFRHPGALTAEFLAGRRRTYTPPLRLYLAISISFFLLFAWLAESGLLLDPGQDPGFDAAVQARFLSDDLPRLMFILLPVFALLMKIVYFRRLYFDHLIFSIHLHCAAYVILAVLVPLEDLANRHLTLATVQGVAAAYLIFYFGIAVQRVYQSTRFGVVWRSAAVLLAYFVLVSLMIENTSNFSIISD